MPQPAVPAPALPLPWTIQDLRLARPSYAEGKGPLFAYASVVDARTGEEVLSASLSYCQRWLSEMVYAEQRRVEMEEEFEALPFYPEAPCPACGVVYPEPHLAGCADDDAGEA